MNLSCEFENFEPFLSGRVYHTCYIHSSSITEPNTIIQTINGKHLGGKSDKDVEAIRFWFTTVNYFPQGLNVIFPNLKYVDIQCCELKSITRRDLVGLENIEILRCGGNKITSLPKNLFENMNKLIYISFVNNDLQFMSSELFKPILKNGIKLVDFRRNRSIDVAYCDSTFEKKNNGTKVDSVAKLMAMIDEKCQKPMKDLKTEGFEELWTTGRLSDITIVTDMEKFKAHKVVLAVQSSVFTSIFEDKMKNRPSDEIHLKNINENTVKILLKFFYTNEVKKEEVSNLLELFDLAAKFKVENLMTIVEEMITDDLNDDNAIEIFELACRFNCDGMKTSAFEFIQLMFDEPLKDELINQPEVLKELVEAKRKINSLMNKHKSA